jgi:DNA helicase-2/ATP-dependent DNA helicase PcrA
MQTAGPDFEYERGRLTEIAARVEKERRQVDARLRGGIVAADELSQEAVTRLLIGRFRALTAAGKKPYFARIDFLAEDEERKTTFDDGLAGRADLGGQLYIGKATLIDDNAKAVVVDWRAPVSTLYYESRLGATSYECPDGEVSGTLTRKRQLFIENGALNGCEDIDVLSDDELLIPFLSLRSDTRLRDIISTIQAEQNRIIRAPADVPLLVQGAAGSGKTTVALHRVAYLIYTHSRRFTPSDFMILGPSAFFLGYISGVLPDLGVEETRQHTYEQFVCAFLRTRLKVEDPAARFERILLGLESEDTPKYKSSLAYRDALDRHIALLTERAIPDEPFQAGAFTVCPAEELRELFLVSLAPRPLAERKALMKNRLLYLCRERAGRVFAAIDEDRRRKIAALRATEPKAEEFRAEKARIIGEHEAVVSDLSRGGKKAVDAYLARVMIPTAVAAYNDFLGDGKKKAYEYEDLAALLHLALRLHGAAHLKPVSYLMIDEAQDYAPFQLAAVREALGYPSCTLLGDLAQGIYDYRGVSSWEDLLGPSSDGAAEFEKRELNMTYRTTVEIQEAALAVLDRLGPLPAARPSPVVRHGAPVEFRKTVSHVERAGEAAEAAIAMLSEGYVNVAIICRTSQTCEKLAGRLRTRIPGLHTVAPRDQKYPGGVVLIPAALAKGLEFDGVVIADASDYGDAPRDIKLRYVAMTRAMHKLVVLT